MVMGMLVLMFKGKKKSDAQSAVVVGGLQQQLQQQRDGNEYFWTTQSSSSSSNNNNNNNNNWYKRVPIQAWTALLKAYAHSGEMSKADSLFTYLMSSSSSSSSSSSLAGGNGGGGKKRKHTNDTKNNHHKNSPNVRTFNTLLRGCMWTAASITENVSGKNDNSSKKNKMKKDKKKKKQPQPQQQQQTPSIKLVGGVPTAQRAWLLSSNNNGGGDSGGSGGGGNNNNNNNNANKSMMIQFDTSSYEYYVTILSQSLRCKDALRYLDQMKFDFGIIISNNNNNGGGGSRDSGVVDPSIMESMIVCLVAICRGYVMMGDFVKGHKCANEALVAMERLQSSLHSSASNGSNQPTGSTSSKKMVTGGKKAWSKGGGGGDADNNGKQHDGRRREESNKLFRNHRLSELRSEATALKNACDSSNHPEKSIVTHDAKIFARLMMKRLFYFSGGGTTQSSTTVGNDDVKKDANSLTYQRWIHSLWHSFGLRETTQRAIDKDDELLQDMFSLKKKNCEQLPDLLSPKLCDSLRQQLVGANCNVLRDDGCLNFDTIFQIEGDEGKLRPLNIELGSGSGDWCVTQSKLNPNANYVTVELRADRVAQTFFKCITQSTWKNMCCVGSDCGSFLRDRVSSSHCRTIFVNHPEPPTQTYDDDSSEEPAHMLNSTNLRLAANCLEKGGKGRLVVVTDNLIYARFLCRTISRVMVDESLVGLHPSEARDLRTVDSFYVGNSSSKLWLYEGKPSSSIGHFDAKELDGKGGSSYFDRLWRTGVSQHADAKKRYIVVVCTSGGERGGSFSEGAAMKSPTKARVKDGHGRKRNDNNISTGKKKEKKPKKRSAEAQKRRNERRLLKKKERAEKGGA